MPVFLLLLIVPLIEIFLFIKVGGLIGVLPTIGIVLLTAILGTWILRRQGLAALRRVQSRLAAGENPGRLLADGAMIMIAGILLLTPGFFTDSIGFLLLIPAVRRVLFDWLAPRLTVVSVGTGRRRAAGRAWPGGQTVDGEYEEVGPDETRADREAERPKSVADHRR